MNLQTPDIRWFHSIDLGNGISTDGVKPHSVLCAEANMVLGMPLEGKTVLDIGAWDGFFSFEAERRGASRVLATDHFCWSGEGWGTKDGFNHAHAALGSSVESLDIDLAEITSRTVGVFDITLFLGVLYHLKDPLIALERVAEVTRECAVVETVTAMNRIDEPVMRFFLFGELDNDGTNYWAPNHKCLENMLREVGFRTFRFTPEVPNPAEVYSRSIVHAWK
jgi:tRNA (mo5U34)-methyltransferase